MSRFLSALQSSLDYVYGLIKPQGKPKLLATGYPAKSNVATKEMLWQITKTLVKALVALFVAISLLLAGTWAIIVGTIVSFPVIENERLVVQRSTWPLGDAPFGEIVAATTEQRPQGFIERIRFEITTQEDEIFFAAAILARPGDKVKTLPDGTIEVNGKPTLYTSDRTIKPVQMTEEYLALCIDGACGNPGTPFELGTNQLIGSIKGKISQLKIERYEPLSSME